MKLRVRSWETKETFRLDVPPSSSLADLKALVATAAAAASSDAVRLSLNRRDELAASLPGDTLQSLGLASGDLLFYTLGPSGFSPSPSSTLRAPPAGAEGSLSSSRLVTETQTLASSSGAGGGHGESPPDRMDTTLAMDGDLPEDMARGNELEEMEDEAVSPVVGEDVMEVDSGRATKSVPGFLKRVLEGEKDNEAAKSELGVLIIAVHAVLLESGFVARGCEGTRMPEGWASKASTVSISYTIPELKNPNFDVAVETVELKILLVGKFADVYGYLRGSSGLYRLCLDASKFVPSVVSSMDAMSEEDEKVIFELWKAVKDKLSLPLLIDLCERNGLPPPPCFTCLPTELKIQILEFVPGADLARVACVNSELCYLSSNDDLWKQKCTEEFPGRQVWRGGLGRRWKDVFASCWEEKKRNKRHRPMSTIYQFGVPALLRRDPAQFGIPMPHIIGGDYDLFPAIGLAGPSRSRRGRTPFLQGQTFIPHCSRAGGFDV